MAYFHVQIDGYKVKFTHDSKYTKYEAYINGLGKMAYGTSLKDINEKVRAIIADNPKVAKDSIAHLFKR